MASLSIVILVIFISVVLLTYVRPLILACAQIVPTARKALKCVNHIAGAARSCVAHRLEDAGEDEERRDDLLEQLLMIRQQKGDDMDFGSGDIEQEAYAALYSSKIRLPSSQPGG